ncbi:MAG: hypothetical protein ACRD22_16630 [Terriglobia bacterium]
MGIALVASLPQRYLPGKWPAMEPVAQLFVQADAGPPLTFFQSLRPAPLNSSVMQQTNHQASNKSIWWWAYFALSVTVLVASILTGWRWPLRDVLLSAFYAIGLVGLWGYLRGVPILVRTFWVAYFCVTLAGAAWSIGRTLLQVAHSDALFLGSVLLVAVAFCIPSWLALWRYAFRSGGTWRRVVAAA